MRFRTFCGLLVGWALFAGNAAVSLAGSLKGNLSEFTTGLVQGAPAAPDIISTIVKRTALQSIDFPVTSTVPGFSYKYNPEAGMFERSSSSFGPLFSERAETLGEGRFNLGFSYMYANLEDFEGHDFGKFIVQGGQFTDDGQVTGVPGATVVQLFKGDDFSLIENVFSFSGSYGITDRWDVGALLPLLYTDLDLNGRVDATANGISFIDNAPTGSFSSLFNNDRFGVGDLLLRTKYRFLDSRAAKVAALLSLRLPTGAAQDFQGLDEVVVTPTLVASREFRNGVGVPYEFHAYAGVQFNTRDMERSRGRYGAGAVLQPLEWLAFMVDVLGSSAFQDDDFNVKLFGTGAILPAKFVKSSPDATGFVNNTPVKVFGTGTTRITAFVPRSDLVDISVGFKAKVPGTETGIFFVNAIMPMTNDGLRASVMPAAGLEYTF